MASSTLFKSYIAKSRRCTPRTDVVNIKNYANERNRAGHLTDEMNNSLNNRRVVDTDTRSLDVKRTAKRNESKDVSNQNQYGNQCENKSDCMRHQSPQRETMRERSMASHQVDVYISDNNIASSSEHSGGKRSHKQSRTNRELLETETRESRTDSKDKQHMAHPLSHHFTSQLSLSQADLSDEELQQEIANLLSDKRWSDRHSAAMEWSESDVMDELLNLEKLTTQLLNEHYQARKAKVEKAEKKACQSKNDEEETMESVLSTLAESEPDQNYHVTTETAPGNTNNLPKEDREDNMLEHRPQGKAHTDTKATHSSKECNFKVTKSVQLNNFPISNDVQSTTDTNLSFGNTDVLEKLNCNDKKSTLDGHIQELYDKETDPHDIIDITCHERKGVAENEQVSHYYDKYDDVRQSSPQEKECGVIAKENSLENSSDSELRSTGESEMDKSYTRLTLRKNMANQSSPLQKRAQNSQVHDRQGTGKYERRGLLKVTKLRRPTALPRMLMGIQQRSFKSLTGHDRSHILKNYETETFPCNISDVDSEYENVSEDDDSVHNGNDSAACVTLPDVVSTSDNINLTANLASMTSNAVKSLRANSMICYGRFVQVEGRHLQMVNMIS